MRGESGRASVRQCCSALKVKPLSLSFYLLYYEYMSFKLGDMSHVVATQHCPSPPPAVLTQASSRRSHKPAGICGSLVMP